MAIQERDKVEQRDGLQPQFRALEIAREHGDGFRDEEPLIIIPGTHAHILKDNEAISAHGLRGWRRVAQVARVLGLLSLYLFLDSYDIRATFNERFARRKREEAKTRGRIAEFQEWTRNLDRRILDLFIRFLRLAIFRGAQGSERKEARLQKQAVWLKEKLIGLGPTFIKIGQALATRGDLLPLSYVKELVKLQDQVPPFPNPEAFARIEKELGHKVREIYAEIDADPIAAASLGQVYRARLHTGEEVAVKVQRPGLAEIIGFDIAVLRRLTDFMRRFPQMNENADWEGMLREFSETITEEMDYVQEGRNADLFR